MHLLYVFQSTLLQEGKLLTDLEMKIANFLPIINLLKSLLCGTPGPPEFFDPLKDILNLPKNQAENEKLPLSRLLRISNNPFGMSLHAARI